MLLTLLTLTDRNVYAMRIHLEQRALRELFKEIPTDIQKACALLQGLESGSTQGAMVSSYAETSADSRNAIPRRARCPKASARFPSTSAGCAWRRARQPRALSGLSRASRLPRSRRRGGASVARFLGYNTSSI